LETASASSLDAGPEITFNLNASLPSNIQSSGFKALSSRIEAHHFQFPFAKRFKPILIVPSKVELYGYLAITSLRD
jgi:hypothetical protein